MAAAAIRAERERREVAAVRCLARVVRANKQTRGGPHVGVLWLQKYRATLHLARKYRLGAPAVLIGEYLTTPMGARELRVAERDLVQFVTSESNYTEQTQTPHGRKLLFPWKAAITMASDLLALDCAKLNMAIASNPETHSSAFPSLCLFFGLLRTAVIEDLGMDPPEYYDSLGEYKAFGWESQSDPRCGTPCFVGPGGIVVSLFSPTCLISLVMRTALRVKDTNPTQTFSRFIL
eukprot:c13006_g1_i1.p1 GENE.c13006_g1_i1~~c13006_g1_i1.p1  ORF type:complete len:235 (+),score=55.70 c13006_g1_i1:1-705(+)